MGTVYKFKSLAGDGANQVLSMIKDGEIYFAPPAALNDPFEYLAKPQFSQPLAVRFQSWMQNDATRTILSKLPPPEQLRLIEVWERDQDTPPERLFQNGSQGIFCTCETWDNRVLWSHYSDNHRGVAVEIEPAGAEILELSRTPITYQATVPEIDFYSGCHISEIRKICATKHIDWAYEREVRFFCGRGVQKIPKTNIVSLYLGMGAPKAYPKEVRHLIDALRTSNSMGKVWQMSCNRQTGKLEKSLVP